MKKQPFHLSPVLRVRRIEEDVARGRAAEAASGAERSADRLRIQLERFSQGSTPAGPTGAADFASDRMMRALSAGALASARADHGAALAAVEAARERALEARRKVRTLERLEERLREEHAAAQRRAEDREVDDLVTGRHRRDREDGMS